MNLKELSKEQLIQIILQKDEHIRNSKNNLEKTIAEKTKQLLKTNKKLENANKDLNRKIKEQQIIKSALQKSEERYKTLLESMHDAVYVLDRNWNYLIVNNKAAQNVHLEKKDLLGNNLLDLFPDIKDTRFFNVMEDVMNTGRADNVIESYTQTGTLKQKWYLMWVHPVPDGILCVSTDITERKKEQFALKESELQLRSLLNSIPQKIFYKDINSVYLAVNRSYAWSQNKMPEDFTGKTDFELFPKKLATKFRDDDMRIMKNGKTIDENETYHKNGEERVIRIVKSPVRDEKGKVSGMLGIFWDITENVWIEEALRSLLNLNSIMNKYSIQEMIDVGLEEAVRLTHSNIGFFHFVNEKDGSIDLQTWSKQTRKFCEVPGMNIHYPIDSAGIWADCIRQHKPIIHNDYLNNPNKKGLPKGHFPLSREMTVPIIVNDEVVAVVGVGNKKSEYKQSDINLLRLVAENMWSIINRKQIQDELKIAKDAAEHANNAKSVFLANMSHEIRTPMNSVIGFADLLYKQIKDPLHLNYLESIKSSGKTLLKLINDILDLSKIEAGKLDINREPVNLQSILSEIRHIFSLKAEEKNLKFEISFDETIPKKLLFDELRLRQVFLNLVGNAIKFTHKGFVRVSVKNRSPIHSEKCNLEISVSDSGIGIPKDSVERVFESFGQQEDQDIRKYGGTGLGLAIAKHLVELMGGTIFLHSEINKGSEFVIMFPNTEISTEERAPATKIDYYNIKFDEATLLIVDDIESNRNLIKGYFKDQNISIIEAENGQEAVLLTKHHKPEVILMDIRMPVLDGYKATEQIRKIQGELKYKPVIIALTASIEVKKMEREHKIHFENYLLKPVSIEELFEVLIKYLKYKKPDQKPAIEVQQEKIGIEGIQLCLNELKEHHIKLYEKVKNAHKMSVIEEFSREISKLGRKHSIKILQEFGDKLFEYINIFDLARIKSQINTFPDIVQSLEEMCRKQN